MKNNTYVSISGVKVGVDPANQKLDELITTGTYGFSDDSSIQLSDHRIVLSDDAISCNHCDMEEDIPELVQRSSGFREVIYRLYLLGKFRDSMCRPSTQSMKEHLYDSMSFGSNDLSFKVETGNGYVITDGYRIINSTDPDYAIGSKVTNWDILDMQHKARDQFTSSNLTSSRSSSSSNSSDNKTPSDKSFVGRIIERFK